MRSLPSILFIAILSLTNISAAIQEGTTIPASEYWERIRSTQQSLLQMETETEDVIRQRLDTLASQWESITAVEISEDEIVTVDPSYLVAELRNESPDLEHLASLLGVLLEAHEKFPQEIFTLQDVEPLKEILAQPEFQWQTAQAARTPSWLEKIVNFINDLMDRLTYGIQNTVYYGRVPLIIAAVVVFLISLYFISRNLSRNLVREAQRAGENVDDDAMLTSSGAMQRAQTLSSQGDYRNAIRYLYLSSLLVLDERGLLRYDRSRTNREYLKSISSKPGLSNSLGSVVDVFDRVWYGFEPVDEETFQTYTKHVDDLRESRE